jgi:DNA modification methylase
VRHYPEGKISLEDATQCEYREHLDIGQTGRGEQKMATGSPNLLCNDLEVLDAMHQVSGARSKGQQLEPTRYHPFPARMPLGLAEHLIASMTTPEAVVLDPMAGSGTTLIAAKRLGREAWGFDLDPLSVLLARVGTHSFGQADLDVLRDRIVDRAKKKVRTGGMGLPTVRRGLPEEDQQFIRYWFPSNSQKQLFAIASAICEEPNGLQKDLAWVVFSSLIIAKSAGASYAMDISRSRPHKRKDKPVVLPFDAWEKRFDAAAKKLPFNDSASTSAKVCIEAGDARGLPIVDNSVDFVLTSPPYLSAIDYIRTHKFALLWMGYHLEELRSVRAAMIGTERGLQSLDGLPQNMEERLTEQIQADRKRSRLRQYLSDLAKSLKEIRRVLKPGGLSVLVLGPTMINAARTDAASIVGQLAERHGLRLVGSAPRTISAQRRSLPPPSVMSRSNPMHARMRREILVALRKV